MLIEANRSGLALGLLLVTMSCGGAAGREQPATPQQSQPAAPLQTEAGIAPEPASLPEAERALERARSELEEASAGDAKADREASGGERNCATACRAFASLRRAADAICRLAGPGEQARCARARGTVTDSERRVAGCGCS